MIFLQIFSRNIIFSSVWPDNCVREVDIVWNFLYFLHFVSVHFVPESFWLFCVKLQCEVIGIDSGDFNLITLHFTWFFCRLFGLLAFLLCHKIIWILALVIDWLAATIVIHIFNEQSEALQIKEATFYEFKHHQTITKLSTYLFFFNACSLDAGPGDRFGSMGPSCRVKISSPFCPTCLAAEVIADGILHLFGNLFRGCFWLSIPRFFSISALSSSAADYFSSNGSSIQSAFSPFLEIPSTYPLRPSFRSTPSGAPSYNFRQVD